MNLRPRWRKVLHDLVDSRLRTALVVVSIAVGVFSIGVIAGTYVIISQDMSASYASNNPMNVELRAGDFDAAVVDSLAGTRGVRQAEGRRVFSARVRVAGTTAWKVLDLVALDDFEGQRINRLGLVEGAPTAAKQQILLEHKALEELDASVGGELEVQLPDGGVRRLHISGIVQDQTTGAGDFLAPPFAFIHTDSLSFLHQPQAFNRLYATLTEGGDDEAHLRQMAADLKERLEDNGVSVVRSRTALSHEHPMSSTVQAILGILGALGVLVLFLSSSLIANTLNALLSQHLRPIGVMKLVGGRRQQISTLYIVLILAYCLIALALAVPLGAQGAYGLSAFIAEQMNFNLLGYRLVPLALVIQIIVGLAVPHPSRAATGPQWLAHLSAARPEQRSQPRGHAFGPLHLPPPAAAAARRRGPRPAGHPSSPPAADVDSQHLPAPPPPGADALHADHGRRHLHCRLQRARQPA